MLADITRRTGHPDPSPVFVEEQGWVARIRAGDHAAAVRYVMQNGRLYESNTLNEIWPRAKPLPRQWWMRSQ